MRPVKKGEEYLILTAGSNLKDAFKDERIDATRSFSNDLYEIQKHFGIEAARQAVINEIIKVIESQGLNVDLRHFMLVADAMCMSGQLLGINRYGIAVDFNRHPALLDPGRIANLKCQCHRLCH